jgi:hypothetical protein
LLGEHSVLASDMMRARIRGDDDFAQAANAALGKNTDAVAALLNALFGQDAANRFKSVWSSHVTALFDYARGVADNQASVKGDASTRLLGFERDLAGLFSGASQGRLPLAAAQTNVTMHVTQLLQQADAYAAHDWATADRIYREAYAHTFAVGGALANALLPPDQTPALATPSFKLRSELGRLLGEHVVLMVASTRSGLLNTPDFAASGDAVNGNTRDLAGAIDTLFGASAAQAFQALWADHVDQLMAYTAGVATGDHSKCQAAEAKLGGFEHQFAELLATATGARLTADNLAKALSTHDGMLVKHADAYGAKNYQQAHDLADATYDQMFDLAGQFADAFGATIAARMPAGGAGTGQGGMADVVGRR